MLQTPNFNYTLHRSLNQIASSEYNGTFAEFFTTSLQCKFQILMQRTMKNASNWMALIKELNMESFDGEVWGLAPIITSCKTFFLLFLNQFP